MRKIFKTFSYQLIAILIIILISFPIYWVVMTSFKSPHAGLYTAEFHLIPKNLTLDAYRTAFQYPLFTWLKNSLVVCIPTIILVLFLAAPAAYILSRHRFPGRRFILTMFIIMQLLPIMIALMPLYLVMARLNLLNLQGLIFVYTASFLPFHIINLKLFFDTIPTEMDESAYLMGASTLEILYRIILPLAKPGLAVSIVLAFMGVWNEYILARTFLLDMNQYTFSVAFGEIGLYWQTPWSVFAVMSIISSIPLLIVFICTQRYLKEGLLRGGIKGG